MTEPAEHPDVDEQRIAREGEHFPPAFRHTSYHCPYCGVLAPMRWTQLTYWNARAAINTVMSSAWLVACGNCTREQYWLTLASDGGEMVRPRIGGGPRPHLEMPPEVTRDYEEARAIVMQSPRGASALLRLATQKLVDGLIPGPDNLNTKIGTLVSNGLAVEVAQALDVLRVIGNNAVHPGEIMLDDDTGTATLLFECLNVIVEDRISRPKRIDTLYAMLPQGARDAIERRTSGS